MKSLLNFVLFYFLSTTWLFSSEQDFTEIFPEAKAVDLGTESLFLRYSLPSSLSTEQILSRFQGAFNDDVKFASFDSIHSFFLPKALSSFDLIKLVIMGGDIIGTITKEAENSPVYTVTFLGMILEIQTNMKLPGVSEPMIPVAKEK